MQSSNDSGKIPPELNPDRLVLTKKDVIKIIDKVIERWRENPKDNAKYIVAMKGFKVTIQLTPESIVKKIWNEILFFINQLLYYNGIRIGAEQGETWAKNFLKFKSDLLG